MGYFNIYRRPDMLFFRALEKMAVAYRKKVLTTQKNEQTKKWNSLFKEKDVLIFPLNENVQMNYYYDSDLCKHMHFNYFEDNERLFVPRFLKKKDIFLDVGANIGLFSLLASEAVGNKGLIYAFEPTPTTFIRLNDNIKLNHFTNIKPFQLAISDGTGELPFHISMDGKDAFNSFADVDALKDGETIYVKTIAIDQFIEKENIPFDRIKLIKIDVEGWEMNVLKGATKLLSQPEAPVLMVEFTDENACAAGVGCRQLYDFVQSFGYTWYIYNARKNKLDFDEKRQFYVYLNLIAIKDLDKVKERLQINV